MPVLEKIEIDSVTSQGYCFQIDMLWRTHKYGFRVVEVPITFADRERGASKMSSKIVREALLRVGIWGTQARLQALRQVFGGKRR
jgi:dolichol-phosphate mannosyltransferase